MEGTMYIVYKTAFGTTVSGIVPDDYIVEWYETDCFVENLDSGTYCCEYEEFNNIYSKNQSKLNEFIDSQRQYQIINFEKEQEILSKQIEEKNKLEKEFKLFVEWRKNNSKDV